MARCIELDQELVKRHAHHPSGGASCMDEPFTPLLPGC